jgi:hypothetical protein
MTMTCLEYLRMRWCDNPLADSGVDHRVPLYRAFKQSCFPWVWRRVAASVFAGFGPARRLTSDVLTGWERKRDRSGVGVGRQGGRGTAVATPVCGGLCRHKPFRAPFVAAGVATAGSYSRDKSRRADADLWDASDFCKPAYRRAGSLWRPGR